MKLFFTLLISLLCANLSFAQILNVESLRKVADTSGWSGSFSGHLTIKKNANDIFILGTDAHIQYKMKKHLVLFKNDLRFLKIEGDKFANNGITHIRHNYKIKSKIAWETFIQGQYNKVNLINFRGLIGAGPRFKLSKNEDYKFYVGVLAMYEYEEIEDGFTPLQRNFRNSSYLSLSLHPNDQVTFVSTTYYQPIFKKFNDYRISSQSSLVVSVFTNLALKTSYTFTYDASPALGIPNSQYDLSTGITYSFD